MTRSSFSKVLVAVFVYSMMRFVPTFRLVGTGVAFVGVFKNLVDPSKFKDPFSTSPEEDGTEILKEAQQKADAIKQAPAPNSTPSQDVSIQSPRMGSGKWHEVTKKPVAAAAPSFPSWAAHFLGGRWRVDTASIAANNPMEDRIVVENCDEGAILCGVFDGHYGPRLAEYGRSNAREMFGQAMAEAATSPENTSSAAAVAGGSGGIIASAMRRYFGIVEEGWIKLASSLIAAGDWTPTMEGSCAIMAYVTPSRLVVGNVGDSRAVLIRVEEPGAGGGAPRLVAEQLTHEHNARCGDERARIEAEHPDDPHAVVYVREARAWYVCGVLQVRCDGLPSRRRQSLEMGGPL